MTGITIVGGGLAGLVAAIECAERGAPVRLLEAQDSLGGRARSSPRPYVANYGPHVLYSDGATFAWLAARDLLPPAGRPALAGFRFRRGGRLRRRPPTGVLRALAHRRVEAPVAMPFRAWAEERFGSDTADALSHAAGVFSFDHDPGRLSAAFVWSRLIRVTGLPPAPRYPIGGWSSVVARVEGRARALRVSIETGQAVEALPEPPVIVATELDRARRILGDDSVRWEGSRTVLLDLSLQHRRSDPFAVSDLDESGWIERFSAPDASLAPPGHSLLQAQIGLRPGERLEDGTARLESLVTTAYPGWPDRLAWRRRLLIDHRSGPLDLPGTTWRERPAIDRGGGVFLAGDMVAAPGLLSEVAVTSGVRAAQGAVAWWRGEVDSAPALVARSA